MSYESVGWPPHRLELDGVDAVGAGSVVTRNVDEMAVVAGSPAKLLRYRGDKRMPTPIWRRLLGRWLKA